MSMPPNRNLLAEYKGDKRVFIETGTYRGDAIQLALDAGYEHVYSMDNDSVSIEFCMNRFDIRNGQNAHVTLYYSDSADTLGLILEHVHSPAVFWLDAHSQLLEDEDDRPNPFPLLDELKQIKEHPINTHTVLIDDILILTHPDITGWSRVTIERALHAINPNYKLTYLANPVKNNLLVAHI